MVIKWVKIQIKELIKKEIDFSIKMKQNNIKAEMKQLTEYYKENAAKLNDVININQK